MDKITLRGMTWDHRRAVDPLLGVAPLFAVERPDIEIVWDRRPLSGFEFTSVNRLAEAYDLIVLDHPFVGSIVRAQSLLPVDGVVDALGDRFVGPSLDTYRMDGRVWAVPIDAATQVQAIRPDLMARLGRTVPKRWDDVLAVGAEARRGGLKLAIALSGVHSLMTFYSLCAGLGRPCATDPEDDFCDAGTALAAIGMMRELLAFCPQEVLDWNAIAVLDAMVARDDLVLCPAVYLYATYAEADLRRPLRFHDFAGPEGHRGSTIGGTGLGISAHTRHPEAAFAYAAFAARAATQHEFAIHHGQPARVEPWDDESINTRFGDAYRATRASHAAAWIRPRYDGYLAFQAKAGDLIEHALRGRSDERALLERLSALHRNVERAE